MEDVDLRRYAALYGGLSLAVFLASVVLVLSFPTRANQITDVLGMPAQVGIVVGVHYYFVTTHKRLLASREYWTLVLYCTGISLIIGVVAGYIQIVSGVLSDLSPVGWLVAISAGAIGQFLLFAIFFSKFIGKNALRVAQKKTVK